MPFGMRMGMGLGSSRGGGEKYTDIELPLIENIIRAWSTRRLIPDYKDGIAIMADRTDPIGGTPDDGFDVKFRPDGTILIPDGADAHAYELHEQHKIAASKLINPVFANCPQVLASNAMKKGLDWSYKAAYAGNYLYMESEDPVIEDVLRGSFSLIVWAFLDNNNQSVFYRRKAGAGASGRWSIRSSNAVVNSIVCHLSGESDIVFTPLAGNTYASKWASFGFVVNRTPDGNVYAVYLNGIRIGTGNLPSPAAGGNNTLRIGSGYTTTNAKAVNDLAIWNTALTDPQMQAAHDAMAPYYAT
jgi:hypothetical protein